MKKAFIHKEIRAFLLFIATSNIAGLMEFYRTFIEHAA
jgi:hypothetical protein